jgi:hypothetical protein
VKKDSVFRNKKEGVYILMFYKTIIALLLSVASAIVLSDATTNANADDNAANAANVLHQMIALTGEMPFELQLNPNLMTIDQIVGNGGGDGDGSVNPPVTLNPDGSVPNVLPAGCT